MVGGKGGAYLTAIKKISVRRSIKVGIRYLHKIPVGTEMTTKELLLYDIEFSLESVAEQGWYKFEDNNKRKTFDYINLEDLGVTKYPDDIGKKIRNSEYSKTKMTLGSLSLKQYEATLNTKRQMTHVSGDGSSGRAGDTSLNNGGIEELLIRL